MRLTEHNVLTREVNTHKKNWIKKLRGEGLKSIIEVIEHVTEDNWQERERYWIAKYKKQGVRLLNIAQGGEGSHFGNQTSFKKGQGGKAVVKLDKRTGELVDRYESILEGAKSIGLSTNGSILSVLKGKTKTAGKFIWLYEKDYKTKSKEEIQKLVTIANAKRECTNTTSTFKKGRIPWNSGKRGYNLSGLKRAFPVVQYSLDGDYISEFSSAEEAGREMNCIGENIRRCCVGKQKSAKGFIWKYK